MKNLQETMQSTMKPEYIGQSEIPDIDLYVDQILNLVSEKLKTVITTRKIIYK